jgi:hypothetical protein
LTRRRLNNGSYGSPSTVVLVFFDGSLPLDTFRPGDCLVSGGGCGRKPNLPYVVASHLQWGFQDESDRRRDACALVQLRAALASGDDGHKVIALIAQSAAGHSLRGLTRASISSQE